MPQPLTTIPDSQEDSASFLCEEETELSFLAAGDPVFKDLVPDDYKAYVRFRICTAFPNIIGPEMHGRFFGFHPQVLVNSFKSLLHQQTNLGHQLKIYKAYRDRIQGGIVGVSVAKGGQLYRPGARIEIPDSVVDAPYLDVIAVLWKMAEGNKELLGKHISAREKSNVSIEVGTTVADLSVYHPADRSIMPLADAMAQWPNLIKRDKKRGIQIGQVDGVQLAFAAGGANGSVPFKGVGYTPNPAETKTARITDLIASDGGEELAFAAIRTLDWQAGQEVKWRPVIYGQDAGAGIVREVVMDGSLTRHGMTKKATTADPLLVIKVHGKALEVVRHASSLIGAN